MSYLDHIQACNRWDPAEFVPFVVDGERLGSVRHGFADRLTGIGDEFSIVDGALCWVAAPAGFAARSEAMQAICVDLERRGLISHLHGERYPVTPGRRDEARFLIDRACAPYFGVRAFGQHVNGYVRSDDGLLIWVARRSATRRVYPNRLDHMAAGGLPWGIDLAENLRKECWEEAALPAEVADRAQPVGAVTYCRSSDRGLKPDVIFCYDLELAPDVVPRCNDDEVSAFHLWPVERVMDEIRDSDAFKLNCNLVIIDFLIRHGLIGPDHPDYLDLVQGLRAPLGMAE